MSTSSSRRDFVRSAALLGAAFGMGDMRTLSGLPSVSAAEAHWDPDVVQFDAHIEPLVRLLEETPRERVLEEFATRIKQGTPYRDVLAALHLAGIRNIPPRPDVGWKFHAVLVLHSAHLASLAARDQDRWLPIFFALDFFKGQQAYDARESDWSMPAVREASVPGDDKARHAFVQAMDAWDDEAADAAAAGLARSANPEAVFELFAWYGMRDFRNIGHKPIYMANGWRTLEFLGWQNAEPMLRSLVYAFLNHHDDPNPSKSDLETDAPWRHNQELLGKLENDGQRGGDRPGATLELLATLRDGSWADASEHLAELLGEGASPRSMQDALFLGSAELLIRQPSIVSLHGMTSTNALQYAYRTSRDERTRRLLLLQNASFLVQFRDELMDMGPWAETRIDALEPADLGARGTEALEEIFAEVRVDGNAAAKKTLAYLQTDAGQANAFMDAARRLILVKCQNGHDYKFSSAVMEDYGHISPAWRDRYLASSVHYLRGTADTENRLIQRTRAALA